MRRQTIKEIASKILVSTVKCVKGRGSLELDNYVANKTSEQRDLKVIRK